MPSAVNNTLVFHYAFISDLRTKMKASSSKRFRQKFAQTVSGDIVRKYRCQRLLRQSLEIHTRPVAKRGRSAVAAGERIKRKVAEFFTRDDVSRETPGKKQTVTRQKIRKQKRLLSDTLLNLHRKFLSEHPLMKISYSLFCKVRPFWVVQCASV